MELLAERLLQRHRLTAPPVNVDELAQAEDLDFGIEPLESVYGSYVRDADGRGHAYIARDQHRLKRRFTKRMSWRTIWLMRTRHFMRTVV